jgi:hypothetical protein
MNVGELASKLKLWHSAVNTTVVDKEKYMRKVKSAGPIQSATFIKHDQLILEVESY